MKLSDLIGVVKKKLQQGETEFKEHVAKPVAKAGNYVKNIPALQNSQTFQKFATGPTMDRVFSGMKKSFDSNQIQLQKREDQKRQGAKNLSNLINSIKDYATNNKKVTLYHHKINPDDNLLEKGMKGASNIGIDVGQSILRGIVDTTADVGRNMGKVIAGEDVLNYEDLKSPVTKFAYQTLDPKTGEKYGVKYTPQEALANVAESAMPMIDAYTGGKGGALIKGAGKKGLVTIIKEGTKEGARVGGAAGMAMGLKEGRGQTLKEQIKNAVTQGAAGIAIGSAAGAAIPVAGEGIKLINKGVKSVGSKMGRVISQYLPNMEAKPGFIQYLRDANGKYAGSKNVNGVHPDDINNMMDFQDFVAGHWGPKDAGQQMKYLNDMQNLADYYGINTGNSMQDMSDAFEKFINKHGREGMEVRPGFKKGFVSFGEDIGGKRPSTIEEAAKKYKTAGDFIQAARNNELSEQAMADLKSKYNPKTVEQMDNVLEKIHGQSLGGPNKGINNLDDALTQIKERLDGGNSAMPYTVDSQGFPVDPTTGERILGKNLAEKGIPTRKVMVRTEPKAELQTTDWPIDLPLPKGSSAKEVTIDRELPFDLNFADRQAEIERRKATPIEKKVNYIDQYLRTPDRVLEKIGLGKEMKQLRAGYEKYKKELPEQIDKITNWAKQTTPEENRNIFKWLDGQEGIQLSEKEYKIANEVQSYLQDWADRLNLPFDRRISNYITHIFESDFEGIKNKEFPDELAKLISDKVAGSVYDPFTQQRLGQSGYIEDTWRALDAYVKRATRKVNLDPALNKISAASDSLEQYSWEYVKEYIDRINMRPTKTDTLIDNWLKSLPNIGYKFGQRPVTNLTRKSRQMIYRGALGLNVGSALKNLSQGANTYAKLGEKYTLRGYFDMVKNWSSNELRQEGILSDDIIQDRTLSVTKNFMQNLDKGLFFFFETAEKINRGAAYYGAKAKALAEGMKEADAIDYAKKIVRDTQFTFGSIDTPPILQSDIAKTLLQFQSYNIKQGEFLVDMISRKEWAGIIRWTAASTLFVATVGKALNMAYKDILPKLPIFDSSKIGEIGIGKVIKGTGEAVFNLPDENGKTSDKGLIDRIATNRNIKSGMLTIIPSGVQLNKTVEGGKAYIKGYAETAKGNVKYPIKKDAINAAKAFILGPNSLPEAREYKKSKRTPLGDVESAVFKAGGTDIYNTAMDRRDIQLQEKAIKTGLKKNDKSGVVQISNNIFEMSDGTYRVKLGDKLKETETRDQAELEIAKDAFKKSGKKIEVVGNTVLRLKQNGDVDSSMTKDEYDYSLNTNKMQRAKANSDFKTWSDLANQQLAILEQQMLDPTLDELEQSDLAEKADKLISDIEKYASYGGNFKKGKKAKKVKIPTLTLKAPAIKTNTFKITPPTQSKMRKVDLASLRVGDYNNSKQPAKIHVRG